MCKEGIRIGRSMPPTTTQVSTNGAAQNTSICGPDPARMSVILAAVSPFALATDLVHLQANINGAWRGFLSISQGRPSVVASIEEYGQIIQYDLRTVGDSGGLIYYTVTTTRLNKDLKDV